MRCAYVHVCVSCPCGESAPWAVFPDFVRNMWHKAIHLQVMVLSHWCCALHSPWASPWLTRLISLSCREQPQNKKITSNSFKCVFQTSYFFQSYWSAGQKRLVIIFFFIVFHRIMQTNAFFCHYNCITASVATNTSSEIVGFEGEHRGV